MTIGPVVLLGLLSIFFMLTTVRSSMMEEIEEGLKGTAAATLAAYDQNTGDYMESSNGDIWKGSYNISRSESLVDRIRDNTGMDVTFFYGDRRIMTSAVDSNGDRILNSPAGDRIVEKVLQNGEEYFSSAVSLDGVMNYGYFMPVYQNNSAEIIGMVFVGTNKEDKDAVVNGMIFGIGAAVCVAMILCMGVGLKLATSISRNIKKSIGIMGTKLYVSLFPCNECAKAIIQAGIRTVVYDSDKYAGTPSNRAAKRMFDAAGVNYVQYRKTGRMIRIEV